MLANGHSHHPIHNNNNNVDGMAVKVAVGDETAARNGGRGMANGSGDQAERQEEEVRKRRRIKGPLLLALGMGGTKMDNQHYIQTFSSNPIIIIPSHFLTNLVPAMRLPIMRKHNV